KVFKSVNRRVTLKMARSPAIHETMLDMSFIDRVQHFSAPHLFKSGWSIRVDTHYLGGMRHWRTWEVADIGVFVFFHQRRRIVRQKVALLQSKRLYPTAGDIEVLEEADYRIGMARIALRDPVQASQLLERVFTFNEASQYRSLDAGSD